MPTPSERRERYRRIAGRARRIPGEHGLRPHTVDVVNARTSGTYTGDGGRWELEFPLQEYVGHPPKVRWLSDEERSLVPEGLPSGAVEIGPITPTNDAQLAWLTGGNLETGAVRHLRITGPQHPNGGHYRITSVEVAKALHYKIRAVPVGSVR